MVPVRVDVGVCVCECVNISQVSSSSTTTPCISLCISQGSSLSFHSFSSLFPFPLVSSHPGWPSSGEAFSHHSKAIVSVLNTTTVERDRSDSSLRKLL